MEFNWLGVAFVSDKLGNEVADEVDLFMSQLKDEADKRFEEWLDAHNLEMVMGVIVEKGSVPRPAPQHPDFIRYMDFRIYPNKARTCFTVYRESEMSTPAYTASSEGEAFGYIRRQYLT